MTSVIHEYAGGGVQSHGYLARPDKRGKRPGVLVFHEAPGLNEHPRRRADMLAELGYVALAADMYGDGRVVGGPEARALMTSIREDTDLLRGRVRAALDALIAIQDVDSTRLGAIGYCFGGTCALELARSDARLAGVVSFHGVLETKRPAVAGEMKARVLACTGSADPLVPPEQLSQFQKEMSESGTDWQIVIYGGAKHAFTNPAAEAISIPGFGYSPLADARAWAAMRAFFSEVFGAS
jgi:dienelactone hydrolase